MKLFSRISMRTVCSTFLLTCILAAPPVHARLYHPSSAFFEDPSTPEEQNALQAMKLISAPLVGGATSDNRCLGCHTPTMRLISDWGDNAGYRISCLEKTKNDQGQPMTAMDKVKCLRGSSEPPRPYSAKRLGLLAAALKHPSILQIFKDAYGEADYQAQYDQMLSEAGMPRGGHNLLSATESVILYDWLKAKLPFIDKYLEHEVTPGSECAPFVSPKLAQYLDDRRNLNWAHYHLNAGTPFFGCEVGSLSRDCFKGKDDEGNDKFPQTSDLYFSWRWNLDPNNTMRIIAKTPRATSYWVRSSPDGRYVGYGLASAEEIVQPGGEKKKYSSMIVDLTKTNLSGSSKGNIYATGRYDPAFTPDGRGFMLHGIGDDYNAGICPVSVLKNPAETTLEFNESGCVVSGNVRTYQSLGSSLGGTDTYALTGTYGADDAGGPWTALNRRDAVASWGVRSFINFTRMTFDGANYQILNPIDLWTPFSGDWTLSPSSGMAAARTSGMDVSTGKLKQLDYSFHALRTKPNGTLELERLLSVCNKGSKGTFSLDEQYFVYHHYVEESDFRELGFFSPNVPEFQAMLKQGTSNIFVLDLRTGLTKRITSMEFGQVAAFPHFRADGWLYFLVRDQATKTEWLTGVWLDL